MAGATGGKGNAVLPLVQLELRLLRSVVGIIDQWTGSGAGKEVTLSEAGSVQFSRSVVSDSLRPHESQHARLPCHHQLPELAQTHVRQVGDAIQLTGS